MLFRQTLVSSTEEVLEKMFFIPPAEKPWSGCCSTETAVVARLDFEGEPPGDLSLSLSREAARAIASDFLALDAQELGEEQVAGVICELANMICGSVLSRIESCTSFRIGSPHLARSADIPPDDTSRAAQYTREISGGVLSVVMTTDVPACIKTAE
jgi:CheY-specific phosphatase CheX